MSVLRVPVLLDREPSLSRALTSVAADGTKGAKVLILHLWCAGDPMQLVQTR